MRDFGPVAAQNDSHLLEYFHVTSQVEELLKVSDHPKPFLFATSAGVGKTALVRWLQYGDVPRLCIVLEKPRVRLTDLDEQLNIDDIRTIIQAELSTAVISHIEQESPPKLDDKKRLSDFMRNKWFRMTKSFFGERFSGLQILGCGFTLQPKQRIEYLAKIRTSNTANEAFGLACTVARELDAMLVLDNVEHVVTQGLDHTNAANAKRIGAFLSVLSLFHSSGFQVLALTKEHVRTAVQTHYEDFSHFEAGIANLIWLAADLTQMIQSRIETRLKATWNDVFRFGTDSFADVFGFITNGPRDLITLLNAAGRKTNSITLPTIRAAVPSLCRSKWSEISTQFGTQWPRIDAVARAVLDRVPPQGLRIETLKERIRKDFSTTGTALHSLRKAANWINTAIWDTPSIDERLFLIGCLAYQANGTRVYPWMSRDLSQYRQAERVYTLPLFRI